MSLPRCGLRWLYSNKGGTGSAQPREFGHIGTSRSGAWASRVPATQLRFVPQSTAVSLSAIQRSVFRLLILCMTLTCPYTSLTRVSTGATTIYPATNPYNQDPFSTPHDNPSTAYPPRGQEYQSSHPPVGLDPFSLPYRQSPSPNHHEAYTTPSHLPHALSPPPPPPPPFHLRPQQQHVGYPPGPSYSTPDLHVPPPPPLSNQTSTAIFNPYHDPDNGLGDETDSPLLRAPSARSQESLSMSMHMPGQYNAQLDEDAGNNIRYGRIPQRVPRRYKTLKRIEYVYHLARPRTRLADYRRSRLPT